MNNTQINLDILQEVLDEHRDKLNRFAELLIAENKKYNLTRIDSPKQIEVRHFLDSLAALAILDKQTKETAKPLKLLDIGSGAGADRFTGGDN
jgi:16S rRNA G527 N7-methylase RsmG